MKKFLLFAAICCGMSMLGACSDDGNKGGGKRAERIALDSPALAAELNTDFDEFCTEYGNYEVTRSAETTAVVLGGYLKTDTDSILLRIRVEKDEYDRVGSIDATPEDRSKDIAVWEYCITHPTELGLGTFLGTKFTSPTSSGVHQTVEETIALIEDKGTAGTRTCTLYSVIPGSAYAVALLEEGIFTMKLMNSYLTLDYPRMRSWLGGDHAAFASEYYILGNKLNMWGDIYVYFDAAKDLDGNLFYVDVHADKDGAKITEIDVYVNSDKNSAEQQLAIWKKYASNPRAYELGVFKEAYATDGSGGRKKAFATLEDLIAHVDDEGRPGAFDGGLIAVFEADGVATNLVMNSQFIYLLLKDPNYNVE